MKTQEPKRIGIWGGSFNPPTVAHKELADFIVEKLDLAFLHWLVCPQNPLKDKAMLAPFAHRLAMVEQVIATHPRMVADDTEQRLGLSLTVNTLRHLRQTTFINQDLYFIIGADCWQQFHLWGDDRAENFDYASFVVLRRPHYDGLEHFVSTHEFAARRVNNPQELQPSGTWCVVDNPVFDMSATQVRAALYQGNPVPMIADQTLAYINAHGLYKKTP